MSTVVTSGLTGTLTSHCVRIWGINAERVTARARGADDSKALVKGYKNTRSDLPVMGAYSRNCLRQRLFGGVTEYMLQRANIPVLMLHI